MSRSESSPRLTRRWALFLLAATLAAASFSQVVGAETGSTKPDAASGECRVFRVRPQDQIWVVNTRWLGCPTLGDPAWTVWKYDAQTPRWLNSTAAEFYAADSPDVVTAMFVHGNRIDDSRALSEGLAVYFQLVGKFDQEPPVRFVIWSWPSEQIHGQLKDVRAKAARSDVEAYYLARFLAGIQPQVKVGVVGYSFGARIIAGGLHLLGGGQLLGWTVPAGERPQLRVAFWAAAEHDDWLLPGYHHGQALPMADHWFITYNCCDGVLARYRFLDRCGKPEALGYSGLAGRNLLPAELNQRIEEMNVSRIVGDSHELEPYLYCSPIIDRTRAVVLWHG